MGSCRGVEYEGEEGSSEVGGDRVEGGASLGESMRLHRGIERQDEFGLLVTHSCSRCRASSVLSKNRESLRVVWDEICLW
jgi:enterochelin esterase-like enzyme